MRRYELDGCVYYVSSKGRSYIPARSLFVFAPDRCASTKEAADAFAVKAGWPEAAERDGAVLIIPTAPEGWGNADTSLVKRLYKTVWKDTYVEDPNEIFKNVWCWETLIFAAGYDEGAAFAGRAAVDHPNAFASVAMINGVPDCYDGGEQLSDRWLLPDASENWQHRNREIPVSVLLMGNEDTEEAQRYFGRSATDPDQVQVLRGTFSGDPETTERLMAEFSTRIRWKNSPDGTPARIQTEEQIRTQGEYIPDSVNWKGYDYNFYTRFPKGVKDVSGLPVVLCMHGHGEPAWMFAQKNGWPELQDETGEFVFVSPDSPENSWTIARDDGVHALMLDRLEERYGIDRTRVYLTGFSNGSMATCWYGTLHPELFAALSPWNSPLLSYEKRLLEDGWEMPVFAVNGDKDHKMDLPRRFYHELFETFIRINGGVPEEAEGEIPGGWRPDRILTGDDYTPGLGYRQGERLTTYVYNGRGETPRFCFTQVRDMPHGAIPDEARATWNFFRQFRRPKGSKIVERI